MTDWPTERPVTTPDEGSTVATLVVALLHVPPEVEQLSVVVDPAHTPGFPEIPGE